jgi:hypothetical protein
MPGNSVKCREIMNPLSGNRIPFLIMGWWAGQQDQRAGYRAGGEELQTGGGGAGCQKGDMKCVRGLQT